MKELILLVLGFVLVNNYALTAYFGLTPLLGFASRREKILALGLSVTGVMLAALILWLLRGLIPAYWQLLAAVVLVLVLVYLLQLCLGKKLGLWFPVIALNSAVLAAALRLSGEPESTLPVLLSALGVGLGFLLGLFLLSGVQTKLEEDQAPKAFRGLPLQILAAAIVALALTAFQFR